MIELNNWWEVAIACVILLLGVIGITFVVAFIFGYVLKIMGF